MRGGHGKLAVQLGNIALPQEAVGFLHGGDAAHAQLCGRRPCQVPKFRSLRPRACREYAGIISMSSSRIARPICVIRCRSTISPAFGVSRKWLPRSLYKAQKIPRCSTALRNAASAVGVDFYWTLPIVGPRFLSSRRYDKLHVTSWAGPCANGLSLR